MILKGVKDKKFKNFSKTKSSWKFLMATLHCLLQRKFPAIPVPKLMLSIVPFSFIKSLLNHLYPLYLLLLSIVFQINGPMTAKDLPHFSPWQCQFVPFAGLIYQLLCFSRLQANGSTAHTFSCVISMTHWVLTHAVPT